MGKDATYYYENIEGGHGGAADNKQSAFMSVLSYEFLEQVLTGRGIAGQGGQRHVSSPSLLPNPGWVAHSEHSRC